MGQGVRQAGRPADGPGIGKGHEQRKLGHGDEHIDLQWESGGPDACQAGECKAHS